MNFNLVHPSIIDLYINALTLHILEEQLSNIGPNGLTEDIQSKIDEAASEYIISARKAEQIFSSPYSIQSQLNIFSTYNKGIA